MSLYNSTDYWIVCFCVYFEVEFECLNIAFIPIVYICCIIFFVADRHTDYSTLPIFSCGVIFHYYLFSKWILNSEHNNCTILLLFEKANMDDLQMDDVFKLKPELKEKFDAEIKNNNWWWNNRKHVPLLYRSMVYSQLPNVLPAKLLTNSRKMDLHNIYDIVFTLTFKNWI